ncbi:hypothetical protein HAX54_042641, partial [Datura stramonium]|nr:hypothetical protein [Datura stramonium]
MSAGIPGLGAEEVLISLSMCGLICEKARDSNFRALNSTTSMGSILGSSSFWRFFSPDLPSSSDSGIFLVSRGGIAPLGYDGL